MVANNTNQSDPGTYDRREPAQATETMASLRQLMLSARAADHRLQAGQDWALAQNALQTLEELLASGTKPKATTAGEKNDANGLTRAPDLPFLAIVGIDRFSGLREEFGDGVAEIVNRSLCSRILELSSAAQIGRINRSSLEFSFSSTDAAEADRLLRNLHLRLEEPITANDHAFVLDVTIGYAEREQLEDALDGVLDRAEQALAKARSGHMKVAGFTARDRADRVARLSLMRDLRQAVPKAELFLCYQPKLDLRTSSVIAVEALVRWRHPVRGLVPPDDFITLAEESSEIRGLTEFVISQALADRKKLEQLGYSILVNVNISGPLIVDDAFTSWAIDTLGKDACGIGFEITETSVIDNPEKALGNLNLLVEAGLKISIDDYGSGLSSLSYLKQIPAHELKIDKAFVTNLTSSHTDPLLVRSTIDLAHALDMEITAEGVDNSRALALLQVMGCDMAQGYYISKPLELSGLITFLGDLTPATFAHKPLITRLR